MGYAEASGKKGKRRPAGRGRGEQVARYVRRARCIVPLRMQSKKGRRDAPRVGSGQAGVTETKARGGGRGEYVAKYVRRARCIVPLRRPGQRGRCGDARVQR